MFAALATVIDNSANANFTKVKLYEKIIVG